MKEWIRKEIQSRRGQRTINLFALMIVNNTIDFDILGRVYRPDAKIPEATVKKLIKQVEVMKEVNKNVIELMQEQGLTKEYLLKLRKEITEKALTDGRYAEALKGIERLEDFQQMPPDSKRQVTTTQTIEMQRTEENILETIKAQKQIREPQGEPQSTPETQKE